ncbi:MAG: helix-turn-helix domain-containing protein [Ruminococcus sp.]|nr:helix-turn-helix domain-containing protein [Ruminococcus sp.]
MDMTSIGKNIRHFRNLKNISQESLAEKTDLSTNYISMIERGEKIPSLTSLIRIANALEVTSDMLLCDLVTKSYCVKNSLIMDRISELSKQEQQRIYAVIETLLEYSGK